jgi:hypothetical protein
MNFYVAEQDSDAILGYLRERNRPPFVFFLAFTGIVLFVALWMYRMRVYPFKHRMNKLKSDAN